MAAVLLVPLAALAAVGCKSTTESAGTTGQPYPCGRTIASADRFADSQDDLEKDPESVARDAEDLAAELREAGKRATDNQVRTALAEFADVYDEYAAGARHSRPSTGQDGGLLKTMSKLEQAGERLDAACAS
ncbi:hypothetical protein M2271_004285 [Streptomyces sp. LBL]|uniref:hypothetical protein n=1 Tax=Streptomyces sp. LBL TaxID=2940562 RepID=UPI0024772638|nr:hypothetical protein [Streptomyces sp. LBL]MDH6626468.1 hypothetical protein [Streptomyces sp. LBL]